MSLYGKTGGVIRSAPSSRSSLFDPATREARGDNGIEYIFASGNRISDVAGVLAVLHETQRKVHLVGRYPTKLPSYGTFALYAVEGR